MAEKEKDLRCSWDGDLATFPDYVRRVRLAFEKTRRRKRKHLGPELVGQLSGRAWTITQEIDHQRLVQNDGAKYLVEYLEDRLARVPVPDAGARAEELLVKLRRPVGMSMASWCATVRESYRKLQRALKRARPSSPSPTPSPETGGKTPSVSPEPTSPRSATPEDASPGRGSAHSRESRKTSKATVPEPDPPADAPGDPLGSVKEEEEASEDDGQERFGEGFAKGYAKGRDTSPRPGKPSKRRADDSGSSSDESAWPGRMWEEMDSGLPEVLPSELLGWLMLRRCNLTSQQRLNILSSVGNSLRADDVERGLRGAEDELRLHEQDRGGKGKGHPRAQNRANFWVERDGEIGRAHV